MINILLHGCGGRMGHFVAAMAAQSEDLKITAGIDPAAAQRAGDYSFPVYPSIGDCPAEGDVIIDFGTATAVDALLDYAAAHKIPCIVCTTGLSDTQLEKLKKTSGEVAVLRSANMSFGVNLLMSILKEYSGALAMAGFDIEIVEKHHNQKIDSPSGTALAMADSVNEGLEKNCGRYDYVYDRSTRRQKRPQNEIGISAVRGGSIVGDHDVIFAGRDEVITLSHSAYSRELFANGALVAARFLAGKAAGLYSMEDVLSGMLKA